MHAGRGGCETFGTLLSVWTLFFTSVIVVLLDGEYCVSKLIALMKADRICRSAADVGQEANLNLGTRR